MAEQQRAGLQRSTVSGPSSIMVINGEETWLLLQRCGGEMKERGRPGNRREGEREGGGRGCDGKT